jgi:hypothetical protein
MTMSESATQSSPARWRPTVLGCLLVAGLYLCSDAPVVSVPSASTAQAAASESKIDPATLPLSFVENHGQFAASVRYESRGYGGTISLRANDVYLTLPVAAETAAGRTQELRQSSICVRMAFDGASSAVVMSSDMSLGGRANYLIGRDESRWLVDQPTFGAVRYSQLYRGIDLVYDGTQGRLKGTFTVAPGVDPAQIRWHYDGVRNVGVDAQGNLELVLAHPESGADEIGRLSEMAPVAWQEKDGVRTPVEVRYEVSADGSVGFGLGAYDVARELVIDPTVVYRSLLGGNGTDHALDCKIDDQGYMYVVGRTHSRAQFPGFSFPEVNQLFNYGGEIADAFYTKIDPTGQTIVFSTYIGGGDPFNLFTSGGADWGLAISINSFGQAAICGLTESDNYPVSANAAQQFKAGGDSDAFVTVFQPNGNGVLYSSYFGGIGGDYAWGVRFKDDATLLLAGFTTSPNLPVTPGCMQPNLNGAIDGFVVHANLVNPSIAPYVSYVGFSGDEELLDCEFGPNGRIYVCGITDSTENMNNIFPPQTSVYQPAKGGIHDGFLAVINPANQGPSDLEYFTYLGGSSGDECWGLAVDGQGDAYVTGITGSSNFPLQNSFLGFAGDTDAFCTRISPQGLGTLDLKYSSLFGASEHDRGFGIALVGEDALVCGLITSLNSVDAFVIRINPFGGIQGGDVYGDPAAFDMALGIGINDQCNKLGLAGYCSSVTPFLYPSPTLFPVTPGVFQQQHGGGSGDGTVNVYTLSSFF